MIVAVDPGLTGAICFYDWRTGQMDVVPMPTQTKQLAGRKLKTVIDEGEVLSNLQAFAAMGATHLFIEAVGGMPGQSAPAAFNFGHGYGAVRMAALACGLPIEAVPAAVWKAEMRAPRDKDGARSRASELIPTHRHLWSLKKDDGKAEAALLALYAERWITGGVKRRRTEEEKHKIAYAAEGRRMQAEAQRARRAANRARAAQ